MRRLPDVLPGHWSTPEGREMAERYAGLTRADLAMAERPDLGLANALFLVDGEIAIQTAAKERMRWLSVQLALAEAQRDLAYLTMIDTAGALRGYGEGAEAAANALAQAVPEDFEHREDAVRAGREG